MVPLGTSCVDNGPNRGESVRFLGFATVLLFVWAVAWMYRVGRSGPSWANALAETAVILALPVGPFLWLALRRRDER